MAATPLRSTSIATCRSDTPTKEQRSLTCHSGHIDEGKSIAAYYYWVFPNMMFNFYPWGLSVNIVRPLDVNRTKVSFLSYVCDPDKLGKGAGTDLEKVEREDEFVVENVQRGIRSSFYQGRPFFTQAGKGRSPFSPAAFGLSQLNLN